MLRTKHAGEALPVIDRALASCPANIELLRLRAFCLHFDGQHASSLVAAKRMLTLCPNDVGAHVLRSMALLKLHHENAAADVLNHLQSTNPEHALTQWGWACYCKETDPPHYEAAEHAIDAALRDWPEAAHFLVLRAEIRFEQSKWAEALADVDSALALDSIWPSSLHRRRAECLGILEEHDAALESINEAIAGHSDASYYKYLRGRILMDLDQHAAARADFTERIRHVPCDEKAYARRGKSFFDESLFEEAVDSCSTSIEIEPTSFAHMTRGRAYLRLDRYDEALSDFQSAYEHDPSDSYAYMNAASVLSWREDYDEALNVLHEAAVVIPDDLEIRTELGRAQIDAERYTEAVATFTGIIDIEETSDPLDYRGYAYWRQDDFDRAWSDFTRSIEVGPSAYAHYMRADILEQRGDFEGALQELAAAVDVDPEFEDAYTEAIRINQDRGNLWQAVAWSARKSEFNPESVRLVALVVLLVLLLISLVAAAGIGYVTYRFLRGQARAAA